MMNRRCGLLAGAFAASMVLAGLRVATVSFVPSGRNFLRTGSLTAAGTAAAGAALPAFAEEAKAAAASASKIELGGGFAINLDIPETGLVNIVVLVAGLFYLLSPLLSESMASREKEIQSDIDDAIAKYNEATARLAEAEKAKAQADQVVKEINDSIAKDLTETEQKLKENAKLSMERQEKAAEANLKDMEQNAVNKVESYINEESVARGLKELSRMDAGKKKQFMEIAISSL